MLREEHMKAFPLPSTGRGASRVSALAAVAIAMAIGSASVGTAQAPIQTRLSIGGANEEHVFYFGAQKFKEALERETGGRMVVEIFPNASLADEAGNVQLMRTGALQFSTHSSSLAASALNQPVLQGWTLPFLYPNEEKAYLAWDSDVARNAYAAFESSGISCLERWDAGFRQISANRAIESIEDLRGLKIRTPDGGVYIDAVQALGADATPLAFNEIYTSLQTGVIDGTELPAQAIFAMNFHEVQTSLAIVNYLNEPICFSASTQFLNSLEPDLRAAVDVAAKEAAAAEREDAQRRLQIALDGMEAAGITFTYPDAAQFREAVKPVYEKYYESAGDAGRQMIEEVFKITLD